jgi:molecular chaperone GrpE
MSVEDDSRDSRPEVQPPGSASSAAGDPGDALAAQRAETDRFRDLYLRERAELENYKKRVQRDHAEAVRYAATHLTRDLAGVLDNLERAIAHAESSGNGQSLVEGVRLVLRDALDVLARHGITRIEAAGEAFDPTRHEAIATVHAPEHEPNKVIEQFQPGYALHGRIVRPAKVSVSAKPPVETQQTDG